MMPVRRADMPRSASEQMRRRTRWFIAGAFLAAVAAFSVIAGSGVSENLVYYWTPADLHAAGDKAYGSTIRLGGMVAAGSIRRAGGGSGVEFDVQDATDKVHVKSAGVPPQMFRDDIGVVVEGTMNRAGYFESTRLMVSHNNEYRAPKNGHPLTEKELKELMKSTEGMGQ
jgi:cytochrome c-type biogenesis protein CcmE